MTQEEKEYEYEPYTGDEGTVRHVDDNGVVTYTHDLVQRYRKVEKNPISLEDGLGCTVEENVSKMTEFTEFKKYYDWIEELDTWSYTSK